MSERTFYQRLRRGMTVFFQKTRFQTAAVHADTDGDAPRAAGLDHGPHPLFPADVAGVDADLGRAVFRRADGKTVVKVDIRHQRQRGRGADGAEGLRGLHVRNGQPRDLAPGGSQRANLRKAAVLVFSIDWMDTGAPPPTGTPPTIIFLVSFRSIFIAPASRYP